MRRFRGYRTQANLRFFFSSVRSRAPDQISIPVILSSLIKGKALLRRVRSRLSLGVWLLIISGLYVYQPFSGFSSHHGGVGKIPRGSPTGKREADVKRCSSSRTIIEIPKHPLTLFDCSDASRYENGLGMDCSMSPRKPPLLWTIPGAGNTWVRNLLEQATGIPTGSVYNDTSLRNIFVGEGLCDDTTLCIKAHPTTHPYELISNQREDILFPSPLLAFRNSVTKSASDALQRHVFFRNHCRPKWDSNESTKSMMFTQAVIIDRNPLEAAFAEVQRLTIKRQGKGEGSHISRLPKHFRQNVNERVWKRLCMDYLGIGRDYVQAWHSYVQFVKSFGQESVYLGRYEELRTLEKREQILQEMVRFLGGELLPGSVECAFIRAEDSRIRRGHRKSSKHGSSFSHLALSDFLISDFRGKPLFEWMWNIVGVVAEKRGYSAPKGFNVPEHQNMSQPQTAELERILGLPTKRWYDDKDNLSTLQAIGSDSPALRSHLEHSSQTGIISSEYAHCLRKALLLKRNNQIVLTFVGNPGNVGIDDKRSIFPVLLNSIMWMHAAEVRELLVVCFDEAYEYLLRSLGVETCYLELQSSRNLKMTSHAQKTSYISEIYSKRLAVIEAVLQTGISVVHTDTDAVWTKNPLEVLRSYHKGDQVSRDIVSSRGTFPRKEAKSWGGSTLCMGFLSLLATPGVRQILRAARQTSLHYHGDDQIGLNRGLAQMGLVWLGKNQKMGEVVLPSKSGVSKVRLSLLADDIVRRNCTSHNGSTALIMHCFDKYDADPDEAGTKGFMKKRGLWLLKEDWFEMLVSRQSSDRNIKMLRIPT